MPIEHISLQEYKIQDGATDYPDKHDAAMDGQQNKINEMVDATNAAVETVSQNIESINTVEAISADVTAVAGNSANINTVADNMGLVEKSAEVIGLNAIFESTEAGIYASEEGDYFSVPSDDASEYLILYRHDAGPVATEIKRYPSAQVVTEIGEEARAPIQSTQLFPNLFDDMDFSLRPLSNYLALFSDSTPERSLDQGQVFEGVFGPSLCFTGTGTASTYIGQVRVLKADIPALFEPGEVTFGFFMKSQAGGSFRTSAPNETLIWQPGEVKLIQKSFTIDNQNSISVNFLKVGAFAEGEKLWISPFILYRGAPRDLKSYVSLSPAEVREKFMGSGYRKQWAGVKNLWKDHLLQTNPVGLGFSNGNSGGSAVSEYDDTPVFDGVPRTIRTTFGAAANQEKMRVYWHTANGYSVKAGEVLQMAFLFKADRDLTLRFDVAGAQNNFSVKGGQEYLLEWTLPPAAEDSGTSALTFPFLFGPTLAGTFWISPPLFYISKERRPWSLVQRNDWATWGKTRYLGKKVGFLGDSMSVNRSWQSSIVDRSGLVWDSRETTSGVNGYRATAVGGTTLIPVENLGGNNANGTGAQNSIYMRAKDLIHYAPDILTVFAGINDKGSFLPYTSGRVPIGTVNDAPWRDGFITAANWAASNIPPGFTMYSVLMGMIENILTDLPNVKMFMFTQYPHTARNGITGLPVNVNPEVMGIIKLMNDCVREVGRAYNIPIVDLEWKAHMPAFTFPAPSPWMSDDGTHLNAGGNDRIYNCLARTMGLS